MLGRNKNHEVPSEGQVLDFIPAPGSSGHGKDTGLLAKKKCGGWLGWCVIAASAKDVQGLHPRSAESYFFAILVPAVEGQDGRGSGAGPRLRREPGQPVQFK